MFAKKPSTNSLINHRKYDGFVDVEHFASTQYGSPVTHLDRKN